MEFKEFDLTTASCMNHMQIIGRRGQGKTMLAQELLLHGKHFSNLIINTTNEYNEISAHQLFCKCNHLQQNSFQCTCGGIEFIAQHLDNACVVFDRGQLLYTKEFDLTHLNRTKFIMVSQLANSSHIPYDYVFIFKETNIYYLRLLYKFYAYMFPSFNEFCKALDNITSKPHTCMVINNTSSSNTLIDKVMWFTVNPWRLMVKRKKIQTDIIRKDLMQIAWHPSRLSSCLPHDEVQELLY